MKIERFEVPGLAQYSYLVSSQKEAIVIDPIRDYDRYVTYAAHHGLVIRFVTETHIHADYASGASALASEVGAELALSGYDEGERYQSAMPHRKLMDGKELCVGTVRLRALHTPGHTPEHLSFVLFDDTRNPNVPVAMFSGDFLFVGSLGRPDLLGEDEKLHLAHQLYRSLQERIAALPDSLHLYPGHGAGSLCGAGMGERPESTLGYERVSQHLFGLAEKDFIDEVLASVPPMPSYYPRMKALNAAGASSFRSLIGRPALSPGEVEPLAHDRSVTLLDLRRPEAFGGAHIPGAVNIGAGQNLSLWAGWLLDPSQPIVLLGESSDNEQAVRSLLRVGLDNLRGSLRSGIGAWIEAGMPLAQTRQWDAEAVTHHAPGVLVLDVRSENEWNSGHIEGARHIALGNLLEEMATLPKTTELVTVCGSGYRSSIAASLLQAAGFSDVSSMAGGMAAWKARGFASSRCIAPGLS